MALDKGVRRMDPIPAVGSAVRLALALPEQQG